MGSHRADTRASRGRQPETPPVPSDHSSPVARPGKRAARKVDAPRADRSTVATPAPRGRVTSYDDGPALRPPQGPLPGAALGADPARRGGPRDLGRWRRQRRQPGPRRRGPPRSARQDHAGQRADRRRRRRQHQPRRQRPRSRGQPRRPPRHAPPTPPPTTRCRPRPRRRPSSATPPSPMPTPRWTSRTPRSSSTCGTCRSTSYHLTARFGDYGLWSQLPHRSRLRRPERHPDLRHRQRRDLLGLLRRRLRQQDRGDPR